MQEQPHYDKLTTPAEEASIFQEIVDREPYEKSMKNARTWLYVIAAFQFIMGIVEYSREADTTVGWIAFGIDAIIAVAFLSLALWSRHKPVIAFTSALVLYILFIGTFCILDPTNLFRGIIFKVLAIVALVKANKNARTYEALRASIGEPV